MQADGNLVVYDGGSKPRWASGTKRGPQSTQYFLKIEDTGELNVYRGTPAAPVGVLWNARLGRRYKIVSDVDIARTFRPRLRFSKSTRCFGLTFTEGGAPTPNYCRSSYDGKFALFATVTRPGSDKSVANPDGNSFRITYGVAFGYQDGTFTGLANSTLALLADVGSHGEDAQYLVVDVVDGKVTSAWADLHTGYYALARGALTTVDDRHVVAWVGAYYHPLKLLSTTSSVWSVGSGGNSLNQLRLLSQRT